MHRAQQAAARVNFGDRCSRRDAGSAERTQPRPRSTQGRAGSATWPRPAARTSPACPARCPRTCARPSQSRAPAAPGGSTYGRAPAPLRRVALARRRPRRKRRAGAGVAQAPSAGGSTSQTPGRARTQPLQPQPAHITVTLSHSVMLATRQCDLSHGRKSDAGNPGGWGRAAHRVASEMYARQNEQGSCRCTTMKSSFMPWMTSAMRVMTCASALARPAP